MIEYTTDAAGAPKAIGPYSQAAASGNMVFLSGQIAIDSSTGKVVEGGVSEQTEQVMKNLKSVLTHLDLDFSNIVKTTIFLSSMDHFQTVNTVYSEHMGESRPARATVAVAGLPLNVDVEIEMVAIRD